MMVRPELNYMSGGQNVVGKKNDKREGELKILQSTGYLTGLLGV